MTEDTKQSDQTKGTEQTDRIDRIMADVEEILATLGTLGPAIEDLVKRVESIEQSPVVQDLKGVVHALGERLASLENGTHPTISSLSAATALHPETAEAANALASMDNSHASRLSSLESDVRRIAASLRGITH